MVDSSEFWPEGNAIDDAVGGRLAQLPLTLRIGVGAARQDTAAISIMTRHRSFLYWAQECWRRSRQIPRSCATSKGETEYGVGSIM